MDIRPITDSYAVSPQIEPADAERIREAGFVKIVCNRPDAEVGPETDTAAIRAAAEAAGLAFVALPVTHQTLTPEIVAAQRAEIESAGGPVLAYCASGTRSTILWALGEAGSRPVDQIVSDAARAGYDLAPIRPRLEALSAD